MAQNDTVMTDVQDGAAAKQKERADKVSDYLQAPRRKRKSYVLTALGRGTADLGPGIEAYVRGNYKGVAVAQSRNPEELLKNFSRQVVLMVFDDEFIDLGRGLELMRELKRRKSATGVPILFLTRHPEKLVDAYNKMLLAYHETDEYVDYGKTELAHVLSKVKTGLVASYRRRSRRYKVDIPLSYLLVADDKQHEGRLIDMSVHGGVLKAEDGRIFRLGEQMKLSIPVAGYLPVQQGDFLKVSAKVRRVFIGGTQAGVSFEHVSDQQLLHLTKFVTDMVNDQLARKTAAQRPRAR